MTAKIYEESGIALALNDQGEGMPVVVLSGWGYGGLMGEVAFGDLRRNGCRVITVDVPGTGVLAGRSSFVHIQRIARALAEALRANDVHDATLVGHSFGTMIAQEMALGEDDVVSRLVLISPVPGIGDVVPDLNQAMEMLNRLMIGQGGLLSYLFAPPYLAHLRHTLGDTFDALDHPTSSAALSGQVWAASRWTNFGRLQNMYQPTLILQGETDPISPPRHARQLARVLPGVRYVELHGCGYMPFLECREETCGAILAFMGLEGAVKAKAAETKAKKA